MFPKMAMGDFCSVNDPIVSQKLVPWLNEQLKKAVDDVERIAMMAALGNIGHEVILPSVMPHISSCEPGSKFEAEWYERHRRSSRRDEEEPVVKKEWRKKWLAYKKKHGKEASVEELMDQFEAELKGDKKGSGSGKSHHGPNRTKDSLKKEDKQDLKSIKKEDKEEIKSVKKEEKEELKSVKGLEKKVNLKEYPLKEELKSIKKEEKLDDKEIKIELKKEEKLRQKV